MFGEKKIRLKYIVERTPVTTVLLILNIFCLCGDKKALEYPWNARCGPYDCMVEYSKRKRSQEMHNFE